MNRIAGALIVAMFVMPARAGSPVPGASRASASEPAYSRWHGWVSPSPCWDDANQTASGLVHDGAGHMAVAVDSRGATHLAFGNNCVHPSPIGPAGTYRRVSYSNDWSQARTHNGFMFPIHPVDTLVSGTCVRDPDMCVDGNDTIHIAWAEGPSPASNKIYYRRKTSAGWSPRIDLTPTEPNQGSDYQGVRIAVAPNGLVRVVARQLFTQTLPRPGTGYRIILITYDGFGATTTGVEETMPHFPRGPFPDPVLADPPGWYRSGSSSPHVAVDAGGSAHIVWVGSWFYHRPPPGTPPRPWSQVYFGLNGGEGSPLAGSVGPNIGKAIDPHITIGPTGVRQRVWTWSNLTDTQKRIHCEGLLVAASSQVTNGAAIVDARGRVHIVWKYAGGALGYMLLGPGGFTQQPAVPPPLGAASDLRVRSIAVSKNDQIHVVGDRFYTKTLEYGLGARDSAAMVPALPGASVNVASGNLHYSLPLFQTQGVGPTTSLSIVSNSLDHSPGAIALGWNFNYNMRLIDHWMAENDPNFLAPDRPGEAITLIMGDGRPIRFRFKSFHPTNPALRYLVAEDEFGFFGKLERTAWGRTSQRQYKLTLSSGDVLWFTGTGVLSRIEEPTGNTLELFYTTQGLPLSGESVQLLTSIFDVQGNARGSRQPTTIAYESWTDQLRPPRPRTITDPAGNQIQLSYDGNHLAAVTFMSGPGLPTYGFDYYTSSVGPGRVNQLKEVRLPRGRVAGYGWTCSYQPDGRIVEVEDPDEVCLSEAEPYHVIAPAPQRARMSFFYNDSPPHSTVVTSRRGYATTYFVDPRRFLALAIADPTIAPPAVVPVSRTFDALGRLTNVGDRWGFNTGYTYAPALPAFPHVHDKVSHIRRPSASGGGQDLVTSFTYTQDGLFRVNRRTIYVGGVPFETDYEYNGFGQVTRVKHPNVTRPDNQEQNEVVVRYEYDGPRRQVTRILNEEGNWTQYSNFDPFHGLAQTVRQEGGTGTQEIRYDRMGNVEQTCSPRGGPANDVPGWTTIFRDGMYRVESVSDSAGKITRHSHDLDSNLTTITPVAGGQTAKSYDRRGFVTGGSGPEGAWAMWVDADGNTRRVRDNRMSESNSRLDPLGRELESRTPGNSTVPGGTGGGFAGDHVARYVHDGFQSPDHFSSVMIVGSPADRTTTTWLDNRGRPRLIVQPDNQTKQETSYDEQDQIVATQTLFGSAVQSCEVYFRDARQRVHRVRKQDAAFGETPGLNQLTTHTLYNKAGSVVQTVGPRGNVLSPSYTDKTTLVRDARQRVTLVLNGTGDLVRENIWDDANQLLEVRVPDPVSKGTGMVTHARYDYTARKEVKTVVDALGKTVRYSYRDLPGQIDTVTDQLGRLTVVNYDAATQRPREVIEGQGLLGERVMRYSWVNGLLAETQAPDPTTGAPAGSMVTYRHAYDRAGRLEKSEYPAVAPGPGVVQMAPERYVYNAFSDVDQFIAGTRTVRNDYNALGQNFRSEWTGAFRALQLHAFNGAGLAESVKEMNPDVPTEELRRRELSYNVWRGTPSSESFLVMGQPFKNQMHVFDPTQDNRLFADGQDKLHQWDLDGDNRPTAEKFDGNPVRTVSYTPGGLVDKEVVRDASGAAIATTTHSYDVIGRRLRSQTVKQGTQEVLTDYGWEFNDGHEITRTRIRHLGAEFTLQNDGRGQLVQESTSGNNGGNNAPPFTNPAPGPMPVGNESAATDVAQATPKVVLPVPSRTIAYDYDRAGNRKEKRVDGVPTTYTYNAANQLAQEYTASTDTRVEYEYDEWGNQTLRRTRVGATVTSQESYLYNHLGVMSGYTNTSTGTTAQYEYWPTGERASKAVNGGNPELYISRFGDVVTEYDQVGATFPLKNTYVQGMGLDSKRTRVLPMGGARRHYVTNNVGSVGMVLDDAGSEAESSVMTAFGEQLAGSSTERYGFAQRESDAESGLVAMRWRMYDPRSGRFLANDPMRQNRPTEHYAYAANNPAQAVDPTGAIWRIKKDDRMAQGIIRDLMKYTGMQISVDAGGAVWFDGGRKFGTGKQYASQKDMASVWEGQHDKADRDILQLWRHFVGGDQWHRDRFGQALGDYGGMDTAFGAFLKGAAEAAMDPHTILEGLGMIPGLGEIADALDGALSLAEGDYVGAALAAISMIPVLDPFIKPIKALIRRGKDAALGLLEGLLKKADDLKIGAHAKQKLQETIGWVKKKLDCFVAGTQVLTKGGPKNIEEIEPGDEVLSRDDRTGEQGYQKVVQVFVSQHATVYHLRYRARERTGSPSSSESRGSGEEGEEDPELVGTGTHPFWRVDDGRWVPLAELRPGHTLLLSDGREAEVVSLSREDAPAGGRFTTYNFEVESSHTYFVAPECVSPILGIWVHNTCQKASSKELSKNLGGTPKNEAAHHIVAGNDGRAAEAREILKREGIPINDAVNGVNLPRNTKVPNPQGAAVHSTLHTNDYYDKVNEAVRIAEPGTVSDTLRDVGDRLKQGKF